MEKINSCLLGLVFSSVVDVLTWHEYEIQLLIGVKGWSERGQGAQERTRVKGVGDYHLTVLCRLFRAAARGFPRAQTEMNRDLAGHTHGACPSLERTSPK